MSSKKPEINTKNSNLPEAVIHALAVYLNDPDDPLAEIAIKLTDINNPELVTMWRSLERHKDPLGPIYERSDDPVYEHSCDPNNEQPDNQNYEWVIAFLQAVSDASSLPAYHLISKSDRIELSNEINDLAKQLIRILKVNQLDAQLVHLDGINFNGFYYYEDFEETNKIRIDALDINKLKMSEIIEGIAERTNRQIMDESIRGKNAYNAKAIRFVRILAARNQFWFGTVLNSVVATAVNTLFETSYKESDIRNLVARSPLQS